MRQQCRPAKFLGVSTLPKGLTCDRRGMHHSRTGRGFSDENLLEGDYGRLNEARLVRDEIPGQVRVGRRPRRGVLLRDQLDLLPHSTLHDDVVTIESELRTFSVQDLLADVRVDQVVQLGGRRFASSRRHVLCDEVVHYSLGNDDAAPAGIDGRHPLIGGEERDADHQEVQHRLGEKFSNAHTGYLSARILDDASEHVTSANTRLVT
jgi:hypothetical protein